VQLHDPNVGNGDEGNRECPRATVPFTHIADIRHAQSTAGNAVKADPSRTASHPVRELARRCLWRISVSYR